MRLLFIGTPDFAVTSLRALLDSRHEVAAVLTRPDRPRLHRSSAPGPSPVKTEARSRGLRVLQPETLSEPGLLADLVGLAPDAIVVVAYGRILPPEILGLPPRWCINLHASLLPKYRGAAPVARAVMAGERVTGVTTMRMDKGLDTGDILLQRECPIGLDETTGELTSRLAPRGADLLVETLDRHERGALEPRRQNPQEATQAPPLSKADGRIDWSRGAVEIANRVRACNPWPLAFSFLRGRPVKILRSEVSFESGAGGRRGVPGQVIDADGRRILVQCHGDSRLAILKMRFRSGRTVSARDAVNGRLIRVGDVLASPPGG
ncbi:MAG: methionyl-tRNA formyltransferase [Acidobacteriota bacterium]